jgi:hypothetical protein
MSIYGAILWTLLFLPATVPQDTQAPPTTKTQSPITMPTPSTATIPQDAMYALGQQSGQLTAISGRLVKIEDKLDSCREDITRIDTIGVIVVLFVTVFWGPIAVERWKHVFSKSHAP